MHQAEDVDRHVRSIYEGAGCNVLLPPGIGAIVACCFRADCIVRSPSPIAGGVVLLESSRGYGVIFDEALDRDALARGLARAVARWRCFSHHLEDAIVEPLARAILLPTPAMHILLRVLRYEPTDVARLMRVPIDVVIERAHALHRTCVSGEYERVVTGQTPEPTAVR